MNSPRYCPKTRPKWGWKVTLAGIWSRKNELHQFRAVATGERIAFSIRWSSADQ